jgi:hypothetical protein
VRLRTFDKETTVKKGKSQAKKPAAVKAKAPKVKAPKVKAPKQAKTAHRDKSS